MNDYSESPLSTRKKRDQLVRRPLKELVATPKPKGQVKGQIVQDVVTPPNYNTNDSYERRSGRKYTSPPNAEYRTSSPHTDSISNVISPPQVSMINAEPTRESPRLKQSKKEAPKDDSTLTSSSEDEEEKDTPISSRTRSHTLITDSSLRKNLAKDLEDSEYSNSSWWPIVAVVVAIMACAYFYYSGRHFDDQEVAITGKGEAFDRFYRDLDNIRSDFPGQDNKTWSAFASQARKILKGRANQPLCLLLLHDEDAMKTADCLAKAVATSIFYAMNRSDGRKVLRIDAKDFTYLPTHKKDAKGELFETLKSELITHKVSVLHDIQSLAANTVMALHGICDEGFLHNDSLKPVIIMTAQDLRPENPVELQKERAGNLIRSLWEKSLGSDKVGPLISRIAAVPIFVQNEENKECQ